jgi:exodeoxyribonuclease VII large subunit
MNEPQFSVSDFVAVLNQTLEFAYPSVVIVGELANLRVSKGRWVYFDLKDEYASVKFFATVHQLPGPLEDGMMLQVRGLPRLHQLYGFSVNVQFMQPVGEGSLKRAAALLEAKLAAEGLFDESRKRPLPYPPQRIGLITSGESAAYHDFVKILNERWGGIDVRLADVQVQGEVAPGQIVAALNYFNTHEEPVDVIVITRGGGSAEDLAAFSAESVTRAVAGSRIPTIVAIGHEVDISLAELAADQRASTPSNAAQLLTPDKRHVLERLEDVRRQLGKALGEGVRLQTEQLTVAKRELRQVIDQILNDRRSDLSLKRQIVTALNPETALKRGYALVRLNGTVVKSGKQLKVGDHLDLSLSDASVTANVKDITVQ